ncbi:VOC family protein [Conexibacter sp. CPCC 206217]|uniref:VOC family protein n=1 Tax=Conexibacter sp. CPCC 206217 TaxID=3064574 RepID=UPI00271E5FEB|nr:VOC family protein [Conexibacter sp. CPCC 206217]MDO8212926.1 VOC family protein [Conexibacter sp. CPCC 206217]
MKFNRSMPAATVIPVVNYPDVEAAVAWLTAAFGFTERVRIGEGHRAQLSVGDGDVVVRDAGDGWSAPRRGAAAQTVMVRVDDVRAHCEQAREHGARIVMEPTDFEYGERQYVAADLVGHPWTFSETLADVAPEQWGGTTINPR